MKLSVVYNPPASSREQEATLTWTSAGKAEIAIGQQIPIVYSAEELTFVPAVGESDRIIRFADGAMCRSSDHGTFQIMEKEFGSSNVQSIVHILEKSKHWIIASVLSLILIVYLFINYGLPFLAKDFAHRLSPEVRVTLSDQALSTMSNYLDTTSLHVRRQIELRKLFIKASKYGSDKYSYKIYIITS